MSYYFAKVQMPQPNINQPQQQRQIPHSFINQFYPQQQNQQQTVQEQPIHTQYPQSHLYQQLQQSSINQIVQPIQLQQSIHGYSQINYQKVNTYSKSPARSSYNYQLQSQSQQQYSYSQMIDQQQFQQIVYQNQIPQLFDQSLYEYQQKINQSQSKQNSNFSQQPQSISQNDSIQDNQIQKVIDDQVKKLENQKQQLQEIQFNYKNGYTYKGQGYQTGIKEGFGVLKDQNDQEIYRGQWKNDQYDGKGKLINLQQEKIQGPFDYLNMNEINNGWQWYEGDFFQGKRNGKGILLLTNDEKFQGKFNNDITHGKGTYSTNDEYEIKGFWKNGILNNYI
ncbi:unnamed protein product [Paramecium sonneborni]|uniref:MORN repeat protein n=1 Tax=Paramecium sonneborni TaxID=65129 RepID=A0A8S1Q344_9CILI|nr:unnamed protein product [Paramecium sonneborni]